MVDLDSNPTKLIEIVEIGKQLLITRGSLTTFSIANDVAKYFAIIPAMFAGVFPALDRLNVMALGTPQTAILSAVIFNALIIVALIPLALRGVSFRAVSAAAMLRRNLLIYGLGGIVAPVRRDQADRPRRHGARDRLMAVVRRQLVPALVAFLVLTVLTGLAYPLVVTGIAQLAFPDRADGSLVERERRRRRLEPDRPAVRRVRASSTRGRPRQATATTRWRARPRTSARRTRRCSATCASRAAAYRARTASRRDATVPPDAVTASGSGLDPDISVANARIQAPRVARARGLSLATVLELVAAHTDGRSLGFLGEPGVNVLELNLALDGTARSGTLWAWRAGTLRIYLGAAAGVGKTFAMLNEGRRRAEYGEDVVVGFVETHGRPKTAEQVGGLEVVPRRRVAYRGATFEELDVDAVLARRPRVALVDELAHTNVPGSRNEKRWQDVEELLEAGHRRHLDAQRPAPRVPQRRRRADHGRHAARDDPRRGRAPRRRAPARRPDPDGAPQPARPRRRLPARADRRRARELLPPGQPLGAARARPRLARRAGRRGARGVPRPPRHRRSRGRRASGSSSRSPARRTASGSSGARRASRSARRATSWPST